MSFVGFALYSAAVSSKSIVDILLAPFYASAANYIPIISLGVWLYSFHIFFRTGVLITKKTYLFSINYTIALILNVISNFLLVPSFGAMGSAVATVLTYAGFSFIGFFIYRKCYPLEKTQRNDIHGDSPPDLLQGDLLAVVVTDLVVTEEDLFGLVVLLGDHHLGR